MYGLARWLLKEPSAAKPASSPSVYINIVKSKDYSATTYSSSAANSTTDNRDTTIPVITPTNNSVGMNDSSRSSNAVDVSSSVDNGFSSSSDSYFSDIRFAMTASPTKRVVVGSKVIKRFVFLSEEVKKLK